jgi:isoleucyl-tRNA synthetase
MEFHRVYHLLNEFCNSELSAFYLDVLKDRLYTYPVKFKPGNDYQRDLYIARRSAQTAIYKITDALARLTAPILSFTADEVWQNIPGKQGSVHLTLFPKAEEVAQAMQESVRIPWETLMSFRPFVLQQLEALREQKLIGKSLEATVVLAINDEELAVHWRHFEKEIAELFNVSEVLVVHDDSIENNYFPSITVQASTTPKCERCWRHVPDVGQNSAYPSVCLRCAEALDAIDFPPYSAATSTEN